MKKYGPKRFLAVIALMLLFVLLMQLTTHAQTPLEKRLTINLKEEPIKTALDRISKLAQVKFTYNEQVANSTIKVSVDAKNKTLNEVLSTALSGQPFKFNVLDQEIHLQYDPTKAKKPVADPAANPGKNIEKYSLSGTISSSKTGETLIAATVRWVGTKVATISNEYGFYTISLPQGKQQVEVSAIGFRSLIKTVALNGPIRLNFALEEDANELETVSITSSPTKRSIDNPQMGMERINLKETKNIPMVLGERDVIKTLQLLPGVKSSGEGSGGFFVRGGSADQNMILLDEAPVYGASHLLGFFSTFNSDAIKNVTLYKSGMPAQYGGGLSSVMDVKMNDGNLQKFGVSGGVGMIAARLNVEGPIQKEKSSFLISARRTYLDAFLKLSKDSTIRNSSLYFYDVNAKANYILGDKDRLYISGYFGRDVLSADKLAGINWGNATATLRWNHLFSSKLFSNTSLIFSNYNYKITSDEEESSLSLFSQIRDFNFKEDLQWYINDKNTLSFGLNSIYHTIKPGEVRAEGNSGLVSQDLENRYSLDNAIYASNTWKVTEGFSLTYGLRLSAFSILGRGTYYELNNAGQVIGETTYKRAEVVKTYVNLEPRVAASVQLSESAAIKASYVRNSQNLHLISNSNSASPVDRWTASTNIIKPELSDQLSLGYYKNLAGDRYELTVETYYKDLKNQIDYRNGADIYTNKPIETQLLFGKGRAYGVEWLLKKKTGRLTGWLAYTLSKSERQVDGINNNQWYNTRQDRTHDISFVALYELSKKWSLSANWVFATGNAVTFPNGKYTLLGESYFYYSARNADRMPAYHRLDLGATHILKKRKNFSSELSFSLYNAYGRSNAYRIAFRENEKNPNSTEAVMTSLFRFVPSMSYDFKF
ncbi:TonB-dependent receptor [Pedobacter gandavensis]|uniref:TonB-dependent receptor plug domain-containing protein n=1 Tax=Pedobacter gandavensis TaxID=2679963 RepID=A0ABR6EWQ0_9SPHI|nr:TonB-dependent receptor [Pedobacter gandavensis]MBB2149706.1 TonB-dependent receptor plug domain-containing protein [Pedobacter gandavensis]